MRILYNRFKTVFLILSLFCCYEKCFSSSLIVSSISGNQSDTCVIATNIRNVINNYIKNGDEFIYSENFIKYFSEINETHNACYFPNSNEEVKLYFFLGDSVLLKKVRTDLRAMKLLIDLYLVNSNNAELSEYYGYRIIPKAATINITAFVMVLSEKTEREANKCIGKLKYIENKTDIKNIKKEVDKIDKQEYRPIIDKIEISLECN